MRNPIKTAAFALLLSLILSSGRPALALEFASMSIHGFVSPGYLKSTANDYQGLSTRKGTFSLSEVGINFSTEPIEKLRIGMQLFAYDFGDEGNFDVVLDWAVGDYRWKDWLGIRAGKVKMPVGFYNKERDLDMLRTSILLPQSIYTAMMRSFTNTFLGGEIYGAVPGAFGDDFEYELFVGTMNADKTRVIRGFITDGASKGLPPGTQVSLLDLSVEIEYVVGGALIWNTPLEGLRAGATFYTSDSEMNGTLLVSIPLLPQQPLLQYTVQSPTSLSYKVNYAYVLSAEYTVGNLILAAEYFYQRGDIRPRAAPGVPELPSFEQNIQGFYGQVRYRFFDRFEIGSYYSVHHQNADDKDGDFYVARGEPDFLAWERDLAVSFRFDIFPNWLVKLEAHFIDGAALVDIPENLDDLERHWGLFGFKTTFSF
jgi:hypothetical protein